MAGDLGNISPTMTSAASSLSDYISGIRFILEDYQEVTLGNIVAKNERMLEIGAELCRPTSFIAAVRPRGIQALRAVTDKGDISSWEQNYPSDLKPLFPSDPRASQPPIWRTTGLWYPEILAPSHLLHDSTFAGRQIHLQENRPLVQTMSGGIKGHMLQYLTRISVKVSETAIVGIDLFYNDHPPVNCLQACPATAKGDYTTRIRFPIEGW
ncbi:uncharacterized protein P174DRAFT_446956 [Aspergillus novofumigatus IBT 16806]|uniref:DUF7600 domain-containing protein n=1 Tax=Aspergillus novofumigatus (strain IBT 16806) TaxID=1392255 RepID=A0A2I1CL19_ASPN1|nr:uncharacterized protein P174DRAFT_446956 [Aspergillus novofumigatus IBT 16806]PKX98318.1 hypothetical protein P174DRAFT_446956 [Aspergillus novofumigatus IBT 16806]